MAKIDINGKSKIKVEWHDLPENYSVHNKQKVKNYFSQKYGVDKANIHVTHISTRKSDGVTIDSSDMSVDNILDAEYQRRLMTQYVNEGGINIDMGLVFALDKKVNEAVAYAKPQVRRKRYSLETLYLDNFMSFGDNVVLPVKDMGGLAVVNSLPQNQSGKTTLIIDAVKFLFHGVTTRTDKNEEIFNTYRDKDEVFVSGVIRIEETAYIIDRHLTRKKTKTGGYKVENEVDYYEVLPDGKKKLLNDEDGKKTTEMIRGVIGTVADFETLVLTTEANIDDLINMTAGESSKTLNKFIGLEVMAMKEAAAREMYNDFSKRKKSNHHNIPDLEVDNAALSESIINDNTTLSTSRIRLSELGACLASSNAKKDELLTTKHNIDHRITTMNQEFLETELETLKNKGVTVKTRYKEVVADISKTNKVVFDEHEYQNLLRGKTKCEIDIENASKDIIKKENEKKTLIESGFCSLCKQKLVNVDVSRHVNDFDVEIEGLKSYLSILKDSLSDLDGKLSVLGVHKGEFDKFTRLELDRDRLKVELNSIVNQYNAKQNEIDTYKLNIGFIEHNKNIDIEVSKIKTDIKVFEKERDDLIGLINRLESKVSAAENKILVNTALIEELKREDIVEKTYKVYIQLVGKKGISKMVLRTALPIINSELARILEDVCNFDVELVVNDKNDINFMLVKDDVSKPIRTGSGFEKTASSLALRCVLGMVSVLTMPDFIVFDEVMGRVGSENIDNMRGLFEKIKGMYSTVFLITHNDVVKDWGDKLITVTNVNNVARISVK